MIESLAQVVKNLPANAEDAGSISGSGRSPGERNGNPLQYTCMGNPTDRGVWWAMILGSQIVGHDLATKQQQNLIKSYIIETCPVLKLNFSDWSE